jgi:hypothetical protein
MAKVITAIFGGASQSLKDVQVKVAADLTGPYKGLASTFSRSPMLVPVESEKYSEFQVEALGIVRRILNIAKTDIVETKDIPTDVLIFASGDEGMSMANDDELILEEEFTSRDWVMPKVTYIDVDKTDELTDAVVSKILAGKFKFGDGTKVVVEPVVVPVAPVVEPVAPVVEPVAPVVEVKAVTKPVEPAVEPAAKTSDEKK